MEINLTAAGVFAQASKQREENIGAAILAHAKVYHFAHYFLVPGLETLALQRLTQALTLVDDKKTQKVFPHFADAVHVVYDGTPSREQLQDPAKKLLSHFVALKYDLISGKDLDALLAEGGEFAIEVTQKLAQRAAEMNQLQVRFTALKALNEDKTSQLKTAQREIAEWESWDLSRPLGQRRLVR